MSGRKRVRERKRKRKGEMPIYTEFRVLLRVKGFIRYIIRSHHKWPWDVLRSTYKCQMKPTMYKVPNMRCGSHFLQFLGTYVP
jgi:hypothetical protein